MLAPPTLGMHRQRHSPPEHEKIPPISANSSIRHAPANIPDMPLCESPVESCRPSN